MKVARGSSIRSSSRSTRTAALESLTAPRRASRRSGSPQPGFRQSGAIARRLPAAQSSINPPLSAFAGDHPQFLPTCSRPQTKEVVDRVAQTSPNLVEVLTEGVRASPGRAICRQYQTERGELPTIACSPALRSGCSDRSSARIDRLHGSRRCSGAGSQRSAGPHVPIARALGQPWHNCASLHSGAPAYLWRLFARVLPHIGCFHTMKYRRTSG